MTQYFVVARLITGFRCEQRACWARQNSAETFIHPVCHKDLMLSAGQHTLKFRYREINTKLDLDRLLLTNNLTFTPQ